MQDNCVAYEPRITCVYNLLGVNDDAETEKAADETLDHPCLHLLTQQQLFAAQGGYGAVVMQLGMAAFGVAALAWAKP